MSRTGRWLLWSSYVTLWTFMLLLPKAAVRNLPYADAEQSVRFLVAKSVHVSAYAIMTILCGWLVVEARFRFLLMFLVMAHATLTEILQQYIEGRTGNLPDVAFNDLGILIGFILSWNWWVKKD